MKKMSENIYDCNFCKKVSECEFIYDKNDSIPCALFKHIDGIFEVLMKK